MVQSGPCVPETSKEHHDTEFLDLNHKPAPHPQRRAPSSSTSSRRRLGDCRPTPISGIAMMHGAIHGATWRQGCGGPKITRADPGRSIDFCHGSTGQEMRVLYLQE